MISACVLIHFDLTNRMWFSMVYSLIDNDTCHHNWQNVVDSRGAPKWVRHKFWPLWWCVSLSIRLYTKLNHIRFVFYHNIKETKSLSWQLKTPTQIWEKSNEAYSLSIRVRTTKNHISLYFLPTISTSKKMFFSELELKKALHDTLTREAWYGLLFTTAN